MEILKVVDRDALARAIAEHKVVGMDGKVIELADHLDRAMDAQAKYGIGDGIEDIVGQRAGLGFDGAMIAARAAITSCVAVAQGRFDAPEPIRDFDPMVAAARVGATAANGDSADIGDAARRIARRIADALIGASADDLDLLASVELHFEPGKPHKDLAMLRRAVRVAYFFAEHGGLDMRRGWTKSEELVPTGNLAKLAMVCINAVQPPADPRSVRGELNAFRTSLKFETEMKGNFEYRESTEEDFLSNDKDWDRPYASPEEVKNTN